MSFITQSSMAILLRPVHTASCVEASTLLPIHFEWGDVTLCLTALRFRRFALLASKVEQCSTFEASTEASANQIICQYKL